MRIRQIKPSFWSDGGMASLTDSVRLFYIGTWQLADDAGWMDWNIAEIGAALYPYSSRSRRERWVTDRARVLIETGRLVLDPCGSHATVPHLIEHQRFGGRPVFTVRDAHARVCARLRADAPDGRERVGKGTERVEDELVVPFHRRKTS